MFKIELTDEIREKHRQYFDKNIVPRLKYNKVQFVDKDILDINRNSCIIYLKGDVQRIHNEFIKYCICNKDDISVGDFEQLKNFKSEIDRQYPLVSKLTDSFEFSEANDIYKGKKYWKVLFELFGYERFGECSLFTVVRDSAKNYLNVNNLKNIKRRNYVKNEMIEILKKLFPKIEDEIDNKFKGSNAITMKEFEDRLNELEEKFNLALTLDNYKNYKFHNVWNSYLFVFEGKVRTCPYCNRQYITPILTSNGKMRGALDHFLPKSKYPYFSMSLYNLIPVCYNCNSSFKGDIEFDFDDINPYHESMNDYIRFYADLRVDKPIHIYIKTKNIRKRSIINRYLNTFKLEPQYNYHVDQVEELILKRLIYSDKYIKDIKCTSLEGFRISEEKIKEQLMGYTQDELKINDEPLAKFRRDIVEQLNFFEDLDIHLINTLEEILENKK